MGILGGISANKTTASTTQNTTDNIDERLVVSSGLGINAKNSSINISQSDYGAIGGALDVLKAGDVLDAQNFSRLLNTSSSLFGAEVNASTKNFNTVVGLADTLFKSAAQQLQNTTTAIGSAYSASRDSADNPNLKTINMAALAVVLVVAIAAFAYRQKS